MPAPTTLNTYQHTQRGPWWLLVGVMGLVMLAVGLLIPEPMALKILLPLVGVAMFVLSAATAQLTVEDKGDRLSIRFGPLPLLATSVPYVDIQSVEVARTTLLDGFGIHLSMRGGWVWNIWGYDCVMIRRARTKLWLGSDDTEALAAFLRSRIGQK